MIRFFLLEGAYKQFYHALSHFPTVSSEIITDIRISVENNELGGKTSTIRLYIGKYVFDAGWTVIIKEERKKKK